MAPVPFSACYLAPARYRCGALDPPDVPMDMMDVHELPTLILFDKSGTSVWASHGLGGLDDAVIAALAGK